VQFLGLRRADKPRSVIEQRPIGKRYFQGITPNCLSPKQAGYEARESMAFHDAMRASAQSLSADFSEVVRYEPAVPATGLAMNLASEPLPQRLE